jgi:arylsulfatase A-like enzyme
MRTRTTLAAATLLVVGTLLGWLAGSGRGEAVLVARGEPRKADPSAPAALFVQADKKDPAPAGGDGKKPNILVIFGDDIGQSNVSAYSMGLMGYRTPNIDRIAREGMMFTDYYAEQSCTAGRSSFITGQCTFRTGLSKVGIPAAPIGLRKEDPTIAEMLKPLGYATGQFGKNHLGDKNEFLPTVHGFDEFFGNLYHLNAEEEPEQRTYPRDPKYREMFGPRGVLKYRPPTRRTRRSSRGGARSASRRSRTPAP